MTKEKQFEMAMDVNSDEFGNMIEKYDDLIETLQHDESISEEEFAVLFDAVDSVFPWNFDERYVTTEQRELIVKTLQAFFAKYDRPEDGTEMERHLIYPNYTNWYEYTMGNTFIEMRRTRNCHGGPAIYMNTMSFDSAEEAWQYFKENCGA